MRTGRDQTFLAHTSSASKVLPTPVIPLPRHVGVAPDVPEDPFTGSATGGMAAYLWHHGLLAKPSFVAEQGHWMNRPGLAYVELVGPRHDIELVKVGGPAITVLTGEFIL